MEKIITIVNNIDSFIWSPYLLMPLLLITAVYFSYKLKFVQFRYLKNTMNLLKNDEEFEGETENKITPLEAFFIGLSSRIGTGNISGIALAIVTGGPGAIFWMWIIAFFIAASSFVENTLAQIFKEYEKEKGYVGGPAYYIEKGLGHKKIGLVFAVLLITCYGYIFVAIQSNTIVSSFRNIIVSSTSNEVGYFSIIIGLILTIFVGYILFGGAEKIADFSSKIVPVMALGYIILAIIVTILNIQKLPSIIYLIIDGAFNPSALIGGGLGSVIIIGAKRGMFSNEGGMGSAPNAAATATTEHPVNQGLIQALGVFIDTIVVCTATAIIILASLSIPELKDFASQVSDPTFSPITITQTALQNSLGSVGAIILTVFVFFFAFSSIIGNYYYSESSLEYITKNPQSKKIFKFSVIVVVFLGAIGSSELIWTLGDVFMGLMAIINIVAISFLFKYAYFAFEDYKKQLKLNKEPIFYETSVPNLKNTVWTEERKKKEEKNLK